MKQLTSSGVEIIYLDEVKGPAVVVAHCSSASHKAWLPLIETLKAGWRACSPRTSLVMAARDNGRPISLSSPISTST